MKKAIFIFTLFVSASQTYAQNFGESGDVWKHAYNFQVASGIPGQGYYGYYHRDRFEYTHDTIISADTFQVIKKCHHTFSSNPNSPDTYTESEFLLFQDSGKVYVGDVGNFELLYDFNLTVGDSMAIESWYLGNTTNIYPKVLSTDSILINGTWRKQIQFDTVTYYGQSMLWIEGVGDKNLGFFHDNIIWDGFYNQNCFIENDTSWFGPCEVPYECSNLNIPEDPDQPGLSSLNIFPNPFESNVIFTCPDANDIILRIFNTAGQKVYEDQVSGDSHQANLSFLEPGVYLVMAQFSDQILTEKIIKY